MAASLVGAGAVRGDATAAHPSKQLGHGQATSRARIDGRAARTLAGTPAPATCPPIWAGRAGASPARQPTTRRPRWGRALRATPSPTPHPAPHERRTWAGVTDPTRPQRARPAGYGEAREEFALLGSGNNPSMVMLRRNGRRRAAGAGPMVRAFGETRTCAEDRCTAQLSRYNPARRCAIHHGWDRQKVTRPRPRHP
jgi:hypothetical protein